MAASLLNTQRAASRLVVHPHEHQRAPIDGLLELVDELCVLLDGLVIPGQLVGGNREGALLRLTNLLLGFEIRLEIGLLTKQRRQIAFSAVEGLNSSIIERFIDYNNRRQTSKDL